MELRAQHCALLGESAREGSTPWDGEGCRALASSLPNIRSAQETCATVPAPLDKGAMGAVDRSTSHLVVLSLGWMQRFEKLLCDSAKGYLLPFAPGVG